MGDMNFEVLHILLNIIKNREDALEEINEIKNKLIRESNITYSFSK